MTAVSTVLALVMLPLNLVLYVPLAFDEDVDVLEVLDLRALATSLVVVVGAVVLGIAASASERVARTPDFHVYANRVSAARPSRVVHPVAQGSDRQKYNTLLIFYLYSMRRFFFQKNRFVVRKVGYLV